MRKVKLISAFVFVAALSLGLTAKASDNEKAGSPETVQQAKNVTGSVVDEAGEPVIGASVAIKGTQNGSITDIDGRFTLRNVPSGATIVVSFIGYTTKEIAYTGQSSLSVTLAEDTHQLSEVVVTAMGITKDAKKLGYAATTIAAADIVKTGSSNFATALYGKASGVKIQNTQGGVAGGVSIDIRGLSSINGNTQPLVILNGVPVRNGNSNTKGDNNTKDFATLGSGDRIRSNGLVDINPEDIDQLTILKGAAATALYGSEAANGAIVITSKKAKGSGVTIDVNTSLQANMVAYVPAIQTKYGPGSGYASWTTEMIANDGMRKDAATGVLYPAYSNSQWGAPYDGREVGYIDGSTRPYSAITTDPWKELFRTGSDQIYNIAINQGSDNSTTRFSYTFMKEIPNALSGDYQKHNFNLIGNLKFNDKLSLDYTANYIVQHFVNRAQASIGLYNSWSNHFGSFLDIPLMKTMYKTSLGYKNNDDGIGPTPDEGFKYGSETLVNGVRNTLWDIYEKHSDEVEQRLLASAAPTWKITPYLTAKARIATDYTTTKIIGENNPERPSSASTSSGSGGYTTMSKAYQINYGDIMLMLDKQLTDEIGLTASAGWQGRAEKMNSLYLGTNDGLSIEGLYMINNSYKTISINDQTEIKSELLKTAYFATLGLSYGDYLYLDLTGRQEKSSTLPRESRNYFYPSASASFLFSEALSLPSWYNYGKFRVAYGIVGNAPEAYAANMAYTVGSAPGWSYMQVPSDLGNEKLKPEKTREFEIGLESKFFNNRAGFELTYYNRQITDMLLKASLATSSGSSSIWVNSGSMENKGIELSLYGTVIETKDFSWDLRVNTSFNRNKILSLVEGINFIETGYFAGGIGRNYSTVGRPMGDYVTYLNQTVTDENSPYYGRKIVNAEGNYEMTPDLQIAGSALPDAIGGVGTSLSYKNFTLDVMTDFRIGGYIFNEPYQYTMTLGVNPDTENREGEGFYDYTYANGLTKKTGIILDGVVSDGAGGWKENTTVIPYENYISTTYDWGNGGKPNRTLSLSKNTWWKLRELALTYTLPKDLIRGTALRNLSVSVYGRNLLYFYKSIPNYDPETSNSTNWKDQLTIGGSASPTRTIGVSLRATF
jgi:TonB-linked SusC/RagA family outer membrane protein